MYTTIYYIICTHTHTFIFLFLLHVHSLLLLFIWVICRQAEILKSIILRITTKVIFFVKPFANISWFSWQHQLPWSNFTRYSYRLGEKKHQTVVWTHEYVCIHSIERLTDVKPCVCLRDVSLIGKASLVRSSLFAHADDLSIVRKQSLRDETGQVKEQRYVLCDTGFPSTFLQGSLLDWICVCVCGGVGGGGINKASALGAHRRPLVPGRA